MNTRLFIQNREIELDENVQFAITKQFEDLSNPTTIINDWSKTVSIPFTASNNAIFGHIYNIDRLIASDGTDKNTGIYFNPTLKMDFRLQAGDNVVMTGYAKMNEIKQKDGKGTYEITLFGQLGKLFQEMRKITFDETSEDANYIIRGSTWVEENIDRNLVYSSWTSSGQTHESLENKYNYIINQSTGTIEKSLNPKYKVTDIIGFSPNNSFSTENGLQYDTCQISSSQSKTYADLLEDSVNFKNTTGIDAKSVIPNGFLPRGVGEFRSYLQLPFIYWNKLFKVFQNKAQAITGYQFELDSEWFNTSNPYWYNLVYMLEPLNYIQGQVDLCSYLTENYVYTGRTPYRGENSTHTSELSSFTQIIDNISLFNTNNGMFNTLDGETISLDTTVNLRLKGKIGRYDVPAHEGDSWETYPSPETAICSKSQGLLITIHISGDTGYEESKNIAIVSQDTNLTGKTSTADSVFYVTTKPIYKVDGDYWYYWDFSLNIPTIGNIFSNDFGNNFKVYATYEWLGRESLFDDNREGMGNRTVIDKYAGYEISARFRLSATVHTEYRTGVEFNLNTLWNKDYNLFDEIIKYCKMYRIIISVDEKNRKIKFERANNYFTNFTVVDWTNKIDKSKDYNITPIVFEDKYVMFNYKDSKTSIGEGYKQEYGVNYGDYRLVTDYNFNDSTNELFKNITPSIVSTDSVLSFDSLSHTRILYSFGAEIFPNNKDKDNKQVDIFGAYFFHNGLANFEYGNGSDLLPCHISDDDSFQKSNNTFFYTYIQAERLDVLTYPKLDIVRGDNMCVFNIPKHNYTYIDNYSGKKGIYENFWEKYINERYNIQNKKITCYVMLTPTEYNQFQWNKFVKIGNQLCIVNKIYDYDMTSNQPTKVDLITIQDINGYTKNNYNA